MLHGSVLIIEDDASVSILLREQLRRSGLEVDQAYTVDDAIKKLSRRRYKYILLDLVLDADRGEQVLDFLQQQKGLNRATPVVIMSANLKTETIHKVKDRVAGMLVKPLDFRRVISVMREIKTSSAA